MQTKLQDYMSKKLQVNNTECLIVILLFSLHDLLLTNFSGCLHSCLHTCVLSCLHSCTLLCLHSCILLCLHSCFHSCLKLFISYYLVSVNFLKVFFVCAITYMFFCRHYGKTIFLYNYLCGTKISSLCNCLYD